MVFNWINLVKKILKFRVFLLVSRKVYFDFFNVFLVFKSNKNKVNEKSNKIKVS